MMMMMVIVVVVVVVMMVAVVVAPTGHLTWLPCGHLVMSWCIERDN
jgi:hypothetical protein